MSEKGELETEFLNIIDLLRGKKMGIPVNKVIKKVSVGVKGEDDNEGDGQIHVETGSKTPRPPIKVENLPIREEDDDPKVVDPKVVDPKVVDPKVVDPKVVDPKVVDNPVLPAPENPRKIIDIIKFKEKLKGKLHEIIASESKRKAEEEEKKRKDDEQKRLNEELARKQQELLDEQKRIAEEQAEWNSRLTAIQNLIVSNSDKVDNALVEHSAKIDEILKQLDKTADKTTLRTEIDGLKNDLTEEVRKLNDAEKQRHNGTLAEINKLKAMMQGNIKAEANLYADVAIEVSALSGTVEALEQNMNKTNSETIKLLNDQVIRIDKLYDQMDTANYNIGVINTTLADQKLEIEKLKTTINDNKDSEKEARKALEDSIQNVKNEADKALTNALKDAQAKYQESIAEINEKLANLKSPDCCDDLKKEINNMNAKIDKMQEEQNRIKLNGFKDKIKGFLEKIKLSASISTGTGTGVSDDVGTGTTSIGTTSIGTDMGPALGSEKLVSSI